MKGLSIIFCCISFLTFAQGTVIFQENFQQGIPLTFTLIDNDFNLPNAQVAEFTQPWIAAIDPENPFDTIAASTSFFENPDTAHRWLITPQISLGAFGNYLTWNAKSQDPSYPDSYLILLSNTGNDMGSFTDTLAFVTGENFEWTEREVNLTGQGYDNQSVYFAFVLRSYDAFKLFIDDIQVRSLDDTGLDEISLPTLHIYPNPVDDILNISTLNPLSYRIYDQAGRLLYYGNDSALTVKDFSPGSYFIHAEGYSPTRWIKR